MVNSIFGSEAPRYKEVVIEAEMEYIEGMDKLNEEVAVKVMGWKTMDLDSEVYGRLYVWVDYGKDGNLAYKEVSNWSGDIGFAWQVVEKLREKMLSVSVEQMYAVEAREWDYVVTVYKYGEEYLDDNFVCSEAGSDLPRAICEAALKAVSYG